MEALIDKRLQERSSNLPFAKNVNKYQTESPLAKDPQPNGKVTTDYYSDVGMSPTKYSERLQSSGGKKINLPFAYAAKLASRHGPPVEESKHVSNEAESHTSSYKDVRSALKDLEAFSLNSSEEINENIEQLIECIENNAAALNKAIGDLASMPSNYPNY